MFYTYSHHKPDGTPFYVGKGCRKRSFVCHKRNSRYNRTVEKYGKENIIVRIYECTNEDEAFALEKLQIMQCKFDGFDLANYAEGGVGGTTGYTPTAEARANMSAAQLKIKRIRATPQFWAAGSAALRKRKGIPKSPEHRAKIAAAHLGKMQAPHSAEQKRKIGEATARRFEDPAVRAEHAEKIRLSWIARRAKKELL